MINLRYHIVSLIAVFLALALGVLIGTTVLDQGVVRVLQGERNSLASHRDRLIEDNDELRRELSLWEGFGDSIVPALVRNRLRDAPVVILSQTPSSGEVAAAVDAVLEDAGARIAGRVSFTEKWALSDDPMREQLALVLATEETDPTALMREAAARIAARLAVGGDAAQQADLLRSLQRNGFVDLHDIEDEGAVPPEGVSVVVVGSEDVTAEPHRDELMMPLLTALQDAVPVVVVEGLDAQDPLTDRVRRDEGLGDTIATVDHGDTMLGELSLVFALRDERQGLPARHFGVRDGAASIAPSIER